jgi:MFS family permease
MSILLGFFSTAFFIFVFFVFASLQPKMVNFESLPPTEEELFNWIGIGLLLFLAFCLLSLLQTAKYLKNAKTITLFSFFLVASGVLSLVFIFIDAALLSDIGKQYKQGLAQPEWVMVYPVMAFQFISAILFTYFHIFGFTREKPFNYVAHDSNTFIIVQYVGIICGLMGLSFSSLGFLFPRAWSVNIHTTMNLIILLSPYLLAVGYWLTTKLQEKNRQWYDEKQIQDMGKSALITQVLSVVLMIGLFISNYTNLDGVISMIWFPLYLFFVLFLFSSGNLFFSGRG